MSEADNAWRVAVDGQEREIEVEHSTMTGKVVVSVDGQKVGPNARLLFTKQRIQFSVGAQPAVVTVSFANLGFGARSMLHLNGRYVEPLVR